MVWPFRISMLSLTTAVLSTILALPRIEAVHDRKLATCFLCHTPFGFKTASRLRLSSSRSLKIVLMPRCIAGLQQKNLDLNTKERYPSPGLLSPKKPRDCRVLRWGDKYQVARGIHEQTWLIRCPRIWQQRKSGALLCFRWNNETLSWDANTFTRKTRLLSSNGDSMGRGLFAMRDFPVGAVIGKYVGSCVGSTECKDDPTLKAYVQENDMVCEIQGKYVDGSTGFEGLMQFANDAKGTILQVRLQNNMRMGADGTFTAARDIRRGEELLWRYGLNYWGNPSPLDLWLEAQDAARQRRAAAAAG